MWMLLLRVAVHRVEFVVNSDRRRRVVCLETRFAVAVSVSLNVKRRQDTLIESISIVCGLDGDESVCVCVSTST